MTSPGDFIFKPKTVKSKFQGRGDIFCEITTVHFDFDKKTPHQSGDYAMVLALVIANEGWSPWAVIPKAAARETNDQGKHRTTPVKLLLQ